MQAVEMPLFCRILDKLDKAGRDAVWKELGENGATDAGLDRLDRIFSESDSSLPRMTQLREQLGEFVAARQGIDGLFKIFEALQYAGITPGDTEIVKFEPRLARGLDYYTGAVFETILPNQPHIGSLTGGGRYDELIGLYSGRDLPAVGTTIGLDRMFTTLEQLNLVTQRSDSVSQVLIAAYSENEVKYASEAAQRLRAAGINTDIFPTAGKLKKPFNYADKLGIPFVAVIGEDEISDPENLKLTLKNLDKGCLLYTSDAADE